MPAEARIEDEAAKALVELVPAELPESAMTDDELLSAIEDRHADAYQKPCEQLRPRVVNQWIAEYLKDLLGAEIGRAVPSTDRNCLTEVLSGEGLQAAACQNGKRHGRLCQAGRGRPSTSFRHATTTRSPSTEPRDGRKKATLEE